MRLGTRGSRLALRQSESVAERLRASGHEVQLVPIQTEGDLRRPDMAPGEGVFVAALARALLIGEIDLAVHSAKDVPLEEDAELCIAAFPERVDARDALVTRQGGTSLQDLPRGARIGTDSPRRTGFLKAARPDLDVVPLHGNVDTRLRRLDAGEVDALVIAAAGLIRLGQESRIGQWLDPDLLPPAPGQGALAVQCRRQEDGALSSIDDVSVRVAVSTERALLAATAGGCRAPVGALADIQAGEIHLLAGAVEPDGSNRRLVWRRGTDAMALAAEVGRELLA
jgi:hydroxymethylbilane synthase